MVDAARRGAGPASPTLGAGLTEDDWKRPTEVPGWSVQDNMTHLTDLEAMILGRPAPDHTAPDGLRAREERPRGAQRAVRRLAAWRGPAPTRWPSSSRFARRQASRSCGRTPSRTSRPTRGRRWGPAPCTICSRSGCSIRGSTSRTCGAPSGGRAGWGRRRPRRRCAGSRGPPGSSSARRPRAPDGTTVVIELEAPLAQTLAIGVEGGRRPAALDAGARRADGDDHHRRRDLRPARVRTRRSRGRAGPRDRCASRVTKRSAPASSTS